MIYLLGGAPLTGKTIAAKLLSDKLSIPVLSTDVIREWMQHLLKKEDYPELFHAKDLTAEEYLKGNSIDQIIKKETKQLTVLYKGILAFIESNWDWGSYILEGTAITPELISEAQKTKEVKGVVLLEDKKERIKERIFERGLWDDPGKYSDELKSIEVEWVYAFSQWLEAEAKKYGADTINIENNEDTFSKLFSKFDHEPFLTK